MGFDSSRRDFLTRFVRPVKDAATPDKASGCKPVQKETQVGSYSPAFPPGVDILLLKNKCIAWGRGLCNRCEKVCPERAVLFIGGMNPRIMENRCTLCDLCVPACPENAILIREPEIENKETKDS